MKFIETCLELYNLLEFREAELNPRGKRLLRWLRARYPSLEVLRRDPDVWITKVTLWPPEPKAPPAQVN